MATRSQSSFPTTASVETGVHRVLMRLQASAEADREFRHACWTTPRPRTFPQVRNRFLALAAYRENPAMGCMRVDRNHVPGIGCLAGIHAAQIEPLIVDNGQASWTGLPGKRHAVISLVRAILRHQPMQRAVSVRVRVDPDHSIAGQSERSSVPGASCAWPPKT